MGRCSQPGFGVPGKNLGGRKGSCGAQSVTRSCHHRGLFFSEVPNGCRQRELLQVCGWRKQQSDLRPPRLVFPRQRQPSCGRLLPIQACRWEAAPSVWQQCIPALPCETKRQRDKMGICWHLILLKDPQARPRTGSSNMAQRAPWKPRPASWKDMMLTKPPPKLSARRRRIRVCKIVHCVLRDIFLLQILGQQRRRRVVGSGGWTGPLMQHAFGGCRRVLLMPSL